MKQEIFICSQYSIWRNPSNVMFNGVNCDVANEFTHQSHFKVNFKINTLKDGNNSLTFPAMGKYYQWFLYHSLAELRLSFYFSTVQSLGTVEYVNGISAERFISINRCARYETKTSDGEALVIELYGMWSFS